MIQMDNDPVEVVGPKRAGLARGVLGPGRGRRGGARVEHGVVDDQLAPSLEQLGQGPLPARPIEHVGLRDRFPGEPASLLAQLVPEPRELLLPSEERRPRREPLFVRHYRVIGQTARAVVRHGWTSLPSVGDWLDNPRSALVVLVVAAPPDARLVTPLGCAVEPLVYAPEAVQSTRIGGIGVVDDAVLERERAHARRLSRIRCAVGSDHGGQLADRTLLAGLERRTKTLWAEVVIGDSRPLLLLGVGRLEVVVEVTSERRCPG